MVSCRGGRRGWFASAVTVAFLTSGCATLERGNGQSGAAADAGETGVGEDTPTLEAKSVHELQTATPPERVDAMLSPPLPEPQPVDEFLADIFEPAEAPREADIWARLRNGFELDEVRHAAIERELRRFNARQQYFNMVASQGEPYLHYLLEQIEERDLPTELVLVAMVESAFEPFAYSHGRASGLWQFLPTTGTRFGLQQDWWYDGRRDVIASTDAALRYFEYLHNFFDGDWLLALAAYNAGEGRVQRAVQRNERSGEPADFWHLHLPAETRTYVPRILALREVFEQPDEYGVTLPEIPNEPQLETVELDGQMDLAMAAEMADVSVETMYDLNPGFNRWATHPDGPHRLVVPAETANDFADELADRDPTDLVEWRRHEIASGQTLAGIADQYNVSVKMLRDVNELDSSMIRAGDYLLVPQASRDSDAYALAAENRQRAVQQRQQPGRERQTYSVKAGDTLWGIASAFDVGVDQLASWNNMAPGDMLQPGQQLVVWVEDGGSSGDRQSVEYSVEQGDSLAAIARAFNVSVDDIRRWNGITPGSYLQPGEQLTLHVDPREQSSARN